MQSDFRETILYGALLVFFFICCRSVPVVRSVSCSPIKGKATVFRCMKYIPRPLLRTSFYRRCVRAFRLLFLSGFSPNADALICPNFHFAFIAEYRSVQIPNYRQVQFASAPGQSVSSVWYTQSNCLPNRPSLITFLANSMSYSKLRHSSRSALIKRVRNFLQECISRVLPRDAMHPRY